MSSQNIWFGYLSEAILTEAILTNIQNICIFKVLNTIILHNLWLIVTHKRMFPDIQIVITRNFVVVLSVGVKRVVCILQCFLGLSVQILSVNTVSTVLHSKSASTLLFYSYTNIYILSAFTEENLSFMFFILQWIHWHTWNLMVIN